MSDIQKCQYCGHVYDANEEVHPACKAPPKPSERTEAYEYAEKAFEKLRGFKPNYLNWQDQQYGRELMSLSVAYIEGAISERKRCEEKLEIAVEALEECHSINMRQYGTADSFQDPAHHTPGTISATLIYEALARISALKATQAPEVEN